MRDCLRVGSILGNCSNHCLDLRARGLALFPAAADSLNEVFDLTANANWKRNDETGELVAHGPERDQDMLLDLSPSAGHIYLVLAWTVFVGLQEPLTEHMET